MGGLEIDHDRVSIDAFDVQHEHRLVADLLFLVFAMEGFRHIGQIVHNRLESHRLVLLCDCPRRRR